MKPGVLVTRPAGRTDELGRALRDAGFDPLVLPLLTVVPPDDPAPLNAAVKRLGTFAWVVLTSANAAPPLAERLGGFPWPRTTRLATVGPATEMAARVAGWPVSEVAKTPRAEGLVELLRDRVAGGVPVLLPQAADARPTLEDGLRAAGAEVTAVVAYDKRLPSDTVERARELWRRRAPAWATVTSPRIGRHLLELLDDLGDVPRPRLVSIGPVTSEALAQMGAPPDAEAVEPSPRGIAAALRSAHFDRFQ